MDEDGQEFLAVRGLGHATLSSLRYGAIPLPNGRVRLLHRCQQLTADHRCGIYETRPKICREFDCATREDHYVESVRATRPPVIALRVVH